ncbi:MAG: Succinyl-CoA:(R)-benzylsuccinate CoA-transferase subunit BbsF [Syntrophaceae bacterium PtaU1.Bin231]|nr:MAG: Succinyl-CoA:(R)-benzylsuccinate CoA-transferase subunit BbsF [Syntrophaceae bacterium PtaU1.Bin231]
MTEKKKKLPLEGIRVIDITVVWAGPFATMMLGDLGAEVIMVESIHRFTAGARGTLAHPPDAAYENDHNGGWTAYAGRKPNPYAWNKCAFLNCHGRSKRAMTINLMVPEGKEIFKELVKVSDIIVENNAPRVFDHLGFSYEALSAVNPRLIMIRASGFGQTGPYSHWRGYGANMAAFTSDYWQSQYSTDEIGTRTQAFSMDTTGACSMVMSALMALAVREKTGRGQYIDLAQTQTVLACYGDAFLDYAMNGNIQESMQNRWPSALQGCYRCAGDDQWAYAVVTIFNDEEWEGLRRAMGNPAWMKDGKWADMISRYKNHDEFDKHVEAWTKQRDKYEVMHLLQKEGVPAGPVLCDKDAHHDPHVNERDFFLEMTQKWCGARRYPGPAWKYSRTPQKFTLPPAGLGEHNEWAYKKVLGKSDEEYERLVKEKHIGDEYLPHVK